MIKTYRIETDKFCITVDVDRNGDVRHCAPLVRRFKGQPFDNLKNWCLKTFNYCNVSEL